MRFKNFLGLSLAFGSVLGLSACGGGDDVSAACVESMETAAAEPDNIAAEPLIVDTLSACGSADEWLTALEEHPGAMGLTERAEIGDLDLQSACYDNGDTPVCEDAASNGRL